MPRYRSRSRTYSPRRRSRTPPRSKRRYDDDRYRDSRSYRDRRSPAPSGLLIRNLPLDARPEDLRTPFERFGPVKDVYLPKNYYTGEPRGFGFVKFRYADDAAEAKERMNHEVIGGREIRIVFAEENRKTPQEMRMTTRVSGRHGGHRRRTPSRSPKRRYRSYSPSQSSPKHDSRERRAREHYHSPRRSRSVSQDDELRDDHGSPRQSRSVSGDHGAKDDYSPRKRSVSGDHGAKDDYSPRKRSVSVSRSISPHAEREYRSRKRSPSPLENGRHSKGKDNGKSYLGSPKGDVRSPSRSQSRSFSPRQ